jgi:hypothetical protein
MGMWHVGGGRIVCSDVAVLCSERWWDLCRQALEMRCGDMSERGDERSGTGFLCS